MEHSPALGKVPPLQTRRTDASDPEFRTLVQALDKDLAVRDGDEHAFFAQFNGLQDIKHVVLVHNEEEVLGCGAFKTYDAGSAEIKRMYVAPQHRRKGVASVVLRELEAWARSEGHFRCILETGKKQPEAIALYQRAGSRLTPNYGQYAGVESSLCFEKRLDR
jgi:GNAT superfamily N-acetyltransferase